MPVNYEAVVSGGGGGGGGLTITGADNQLVRLNGTSAIQNSGITLSDAGVLNRASADITISTTTSGALILAPVGGVDVATPAVTSGVPFSIRVTDPAHTGLTAGAVPSVILDLSSTKQITAGLAPLTFLSGIKVTAPTYGFTASQDTYITATLHIDRGPQDGTNATAFTSAGIFLGTIDGGTNNLVHGDLTILPTGISNGVGDVDSRFGISIIGGPGVSLGNQTAELDEWITCAIASIPLYSTTNTRTVRDGITLKLGGAPGAGSNVSITNSYALYVTSGLSYFRDLIQQITTVGVESLALIDSSATVVSDVDGNSVFRGRLDINQGMTSGNSTYCYEGHLEGHASDTDHNYKIYNATVQKNSGTSSTTAFDAGSNFNYALHATSGDIEFAGYDAVIGSAIESVAGRNLTIHAGSPIGGNTDGGDLRLQTTAKAGSGAIGNIVIYGGSSAAHFSASQTTAPTSNVTGTALNDGGGSGASTSIVAGSTDTNGKINITAGTGGAPGVGKAAAVVFNQPFKAAPKVVMITPAVPAAVGSSGYVATISATGFEIWFNAGVSSGAATTFYYFVAA